MAVSGSVAGQGDIEFFELNLLGGIDYAAAALGATNSGGSLGDPMIALYDNQGNMLAFQDDSWALGGLDPLMQFRVSTSGTYWLGVADATGGNGGSFTVSVNHAGIPHLPGGG